MLILVSVWATASQLDGAVGGTKAAALEVPGMARCPCKLTRAAATRSRPKPATALLILAVIVRLLYSIDAPSKVVDEIYFRSGAQEEGSGISSSTRPSAAAIVTRKTK